MENDFMSGFLAGQGNNERGSNFLGSEGIWAVIIFAILFGWGRGGNAGFGGFGTDAGAAANYVLSSDFATLQRMIGDGNNMIERKLDNQNAGICDLGYAQAQLINGVNNNITTQGYETRLGVNALGQQMAQCCCDLKQGINGINYNTAFLVNGLSREVERGFCDTNYNAQTHHFATMQAIDKLGDRIERRMTEHETQALRDENEALRRSIDYDRLYYRLAQQPNGYSCC